MTTRRHGQHVNTEAKSTKEWTGCTHGTGGGGGQEAEGLGLTQGSCSRRRWRPEALGVRRRGGDEADGRQRRPAVEEPRRREASWPQAAMVELDHGER